MKIRQGFVSNSSSTSFTIYGVRKDFNFDDFLKAKIVTKKQKKEFEEDPYSVIQDIQTKLLDEFGLTLYYDYECEEVYIGVDPQNIKDDETGLQFKTRVEKSLKDIFKGSFISCEWISEEIQN